MPVRWQSCPEKQMAQRLGWAILLTIRHATCLIMLDRSTSTHQHRSGPGLIPAIGRVRKLDQSLGRVRHAYIRFRGMGAACLLRVLPRRRFCVGPALSPGAS